MKSVVITPEKVPIQIRVVRGMLKSTVSTSLEKRFTMRPMGVVSKKLMGARRMERSRSEWKTRDACTQPIAMANDWPRTVMAGEEERSIRKSNFFSLYQY